MLMKIANIDHSIARIERMTLKTVRYLIFILLSILLFSCVPTMFHAKDSNANKRNDTIGSTLIKPKLAKSSHGSNLSGSKTIRNIEGHEQPNKDMKSDSVLTDKQKDDFDHQRDFSKKIVGESSDKEAASKRLV
ncbi:MAG: hypothetical protein V1897_01515, partial [Pseudomonadota bacterium]